MARLQDAEHAYKILTILLHPERTYPICSTHIRRFRLMATLAAPPALQRCSCRAMPER